MDSKAMTMAFVLSAQIQAGFNKIFANAGKSISDVAADMQRLNQRLANVSGVQSANAAMQGLQQRLADVSATRKAADAMNALQNRAAEARGKLERLTQGISENGTRTRATSSQLRTARAALDQANVAYGRQKSLVDSLTRANGLQGQSIGKMLAQEAKLQATIERTNGFMTKRAALLSNARSLTGEMSLNAAYLAGAVTYARSGADRVINLGRDFQKQMSSVAAVSGATEKELVALQEQARSLGASTVWSASEAAQGMQYLAMAGFKTNETLQAMPGMLSLATAGEIDLGKAADIASNILTGFGLSAAEMGRVGDVLTSTFTSSNTTLAMLGDTMKYAAPVAKALGVDIETAAAMAGKLGDAGIQGQMAGTTLRSVMLKLSAPTKKASETLAKLGVSVADSSGKMRSFPDILADLQKATSSMSNTARSEAVKAIFETEAMSGAMVLMEQAGSGALQKFADGLAKTGSAAEVARRKANNLDGDIRGLNSATEELYLSVYAQLEPTLRSVTQSMISMAQRAGEWVKQNQTLVVIMAKVAAVVAAAGAAIFPLAFAWKACNLAIQVGQAALLGYKGVALACQTAMMLVRGEIVATTVAQKAFTAVMALGSKVLVFARNAMAGFNIALLANPIGLVVAGIAGLVAGIVLLYNKCDWFRGKVQALFGVLIAGWEKVKDVWDKLTGWFGKSHETEVTVNEKVNQANARVAAAVVPGEDDGLGVHDEDIPAMASGGVVTRKTIAMVGEGGEPEAVMPLSSLQVALERMAKVAAAAAVPATLAMAQPALAMQPMAQDGESPMRRIISMPADRFSAPAAAPQISVQFAPVINISGAAADDAYASVTRALTEGRRSFEREFERFMSEKRRLSFA